MADALLRTTPDPRSALLAGVRNFRDLGGHEAAGGAVAVGRLFRSGSLDYLSARSRIQLNEELGTRTVVDLRLPEPVADGIPGGHLLPSICWTSTDPLIVPGIDLASVYAHIYRTQALTVRRVIEHIADADYPLVFHCGGGRDRTGLIAAVLLGVLRVDDEDIVSDYALSDGASPGTMARTLAMLGHDHGSVLGYALDIGLDVTTVETLNRRLIA